MDGKRAYYNGLIFHCFVRDSYHTTQLRYFFIEFCCTLYIYVSQTLE